MPDSEMTRDQAAKSLSEAMEREAAERRKGADQFLSELRESLARAREVNERLQKSVEQAKRDAAKREIG